MIRILIVSFTFIYVTSSTTANAQILPEYWYGSYQLSGEEADDGVFLSCPSTLLVTQAEPGVLFNFGEEKFIYKNINQGRVVDKFVLTTVTKETFKDNTFRSFRKKCFPFACWAKRLHVEREITFVEENALHWTIYSETGTKTCKYSKQSLATK